jgi:thiamine biosynthesis lipoprotein
MVSVWGGERTQVHMGTLISARIADANLSDEVFTLFQDLDRRLSTYKSDSEISRLNREHEADVSPVTRDILKRSIEINRLTHGAFDVTIGSLSHGAYRFGTDERIPTQGEIDRLRRFVGADRLRLDKGRLRVLPGTVIDLGGIAKGYAVDLACDLVKRHGVDEAVIAASGDIGCLKECEVMIVDPFHPEGFIARIESTLPRFSISTSGNYERYIRTKEHNHLLNPKTGKSERIFASVTLMGEGDNTTLDALSTAVAVMEEKEALSLLESMPKIRYYLVRNDGRVIQSPLLEKWEGVRFSN